MTLDAQLVPQPLARGRRFAVVAPHHLATAAGLDVLRSGGSAVDAAIATNAVLGVVMPSACGIGGDAFWLIWDAKERRQHALNGSGRAPAGVDAERLRDGGLDRLPLRGPLTITVPGAVRSWSDAHAGFGRLPQERLLGPAIELAAGGFPAWDGFIEAVERTLPAVDEALASRAGFHDVYRPVGRAWRPGEIVRLPALAATLERLAAAGFDDFYDGEVAERQARGLEHVGSAIRVDDLRTHRSTWGEPIASDYRGVRVTTHAPNSQGFVALEILNILERFEPPSGPEPAATARWLHLGIEASKLAMADRDRFLTDPDFADIPLDRLIAKDYASELAARIDPARASAAPAATVPGRGGTIWLGVVDGEGNAVSLIESNYMGFGSGVVDPKTGIHYHNRGSFFSLDPGHANVLEPGKRTLHTLMPGMLFRDGRPWVVVGSMGGDAQPQIHAQVVSALVEGGADIGTAVAAPRWFVEPAGHFAPPVEVRAEPRFGAGVLEKLEALGHPVTRTSPFDGLLGHCHAIEILDGSLAAATDPRSAGLPAAW